MNTSFTPVAPVDQVKQAKAEGRVHPLFRSAAAQTKWLNAVARAALAKVQA